MKKAVERFWFFIGIAFAFGIAFWKPEWGADLRRWRVVPVGVFLTFVLTGATLDLREIVRHRQHGRALIAAVVSTLLFLPPVARAAAGVVFPDRPDFILGVTLIAAAPVTVASGTIMTAMAGGHVPLSLAICVATNLAALISMPAILPPLLRLDQPIAMPAGRILASLATTVLLPTVLGSLLRFRIRPWLGAWTRPFSQTVVLLIIFNAAAASAPRASEAGAALARLLIFIVALRAAVLAFHAALARALRLDRPARAAFTIHTSQKTLIVSSLVWEGYFAAAFPLGMLPGIAYHLAQMVMDTALARALRRGADRAAALTPAR